VRLMGQEPRFRPQAARVRPDCLAALRPSSPHALVPRIGAGRDPGAQPTMKLTIGKKSFPVASLAEASARYQQFRGAKLSSRIGEGVVFDEAGIEVARVSYNGRVWAPGPWTSGREPIMEAVEADISRSAGSIAHLSRGPVPRVFSVPAQRVPS